MIENWKRTANGLGYVVQVARHFGQGGGYMVQEVATLEAANRFGHNMALHATRAEARRDFDAR